MCRNPAEESAFYNLAGAMIAITLAAGLLYVGVKLGSKREVMRASHACVDTAVARGWIKP